MKYHKSFVPIMVSTVDKNLYPISELIDGFTSIGDLIKKGFSYEDISTFIDFFLEKKKLVFKHQWGLLYWCHVCKVPILDRTCSCGFSCNNPIELKYPCNPRPVLPCDKPMFEAVGLPWLDGGGFCILNYYQRPEYEGWEIISSGRIIGDIKRFSDGEYIFKGNSDLICMNNIQFENIVISNKERLGRLAKESIHFIKKKCKKKMGISILSFSGGKDSVVLHHLCRSAKIKMIASTIDTGIDPPMTREFSKKYLSRSLHFVSENHDLFWRALKILGPPSNDFHWCRDILKNSAPFRKPAFFHSIIRLLKLEVTVLHGARRREESKRVTLDPVLETTSLSEPLGKVKSKVIYPILEFTDLDIWMYINLHKLPLNPVYDYENSTRMVCVFCPDRTKSEIENSKRVYKNHWEKFSPELETWRQTFKYPIEWIKENLWAYNEPTLPRMKELGIDSRIEKIKDNLSSHLSVCQRYKENKDFIISSKIISKFSLLDMYKWLRIFKDSKIIKKRLSVKISFFNGVKIYLGKEGELRCYGVKKDLVEDIFVLVKNRIMSYFNCLGCGLCRAYTKNICIKKNKAVVIGRSSMDEIRKVTSNCIVNEWGVERAIGGINGF